MTRHSHTLLAIDPGTNKTGLAWFNKETLVGTLTMDASLNRVPLERRKQLAMDLTCFLNLKSFQLVICEEPMLLGKSNTPMQRYLGMIELLIKDSLKFIHPKTVKKLMGCGSLDKQEVALAAGGLLTTSAEQDILAEAIHREAWDETDAIAIGLAFIKQLKEK